MKRWVYVFAGILAVVLFGTTQAFATNEFTPKIIITEIKIGGGSEPKEFVELYNITDSPVVIEDWIIEHPRASDGVADCGVYPWLTTADEPKTVRSTILTSADINNPLTIEPRGMITIQVVLNDNQSSSLRLLEITQDATPLQHDLVGWGESAPCFEGFATPLIPQNFSIKRQFDFDGRPVDTDDNLADFSDEPQDPNPQDTPPVDEVEEDESSATIESVCEGIIVSEILPNPAGLDTNSEFIEIYNNTDQTLLLRDCVLQVATKKFILDGIELGSGEYRALYDSQTGLTLSNAAGGEVFIITSQDEIDAVTYPGGLKDNVAWALVDGKWYETYQPTPDIMNLLQLPVKEVSQTDDDSELQPCRADQYRNPATNRCRLITSATSILVPCAANQYRNPETNRCRLISSTISTPKPCGPNQERNPATNRCRNIVSSDVPKAAFAVEPIKDSAKAFVGWWALGGVSVFAFGYAGWEWRHEVATAIRKVGSFFTSSK